MSKICKSCQTVNEDKFSYCKNCGTPLDATEQPTYASNPYKNERRFNPVPNEIDGIPTEDLQSFVGKNQMKILDKFAKMSITGSKISWCWPAAVLSIFFGFFGAAFWLFYRKMYKYGTIAMAIGLLILGVNTAITYNANIELFNSVANIVFSLHGSSPDFADITTIFNDSLASYSASKSVLISNFINETATYCSAIFYGIFGMYLYKKHAVSKISAYRTVNLQNDYYSFGIASIGGTSLGIAALSVFLTIVLQNTISFIPLLIHILF